MDYLRLIWIVDYSGPRGAAWPRVSISEPLAFTSTLLSSSASASFSTRVTKPLGVHPHSPPLPAPSPRPPPPLQQPPISSCFLPTPQRVAHRPPRGSFSQQFVCSDVARPAADYMPSRNPMLRESRISGRSPVFLTIQNLRNFRGGHPPDGIAA